MQVLQAARVAVVAQQLGAVLVGAVAHQVSHQTHERQVDRLTQCFTQSRVAPVVLAAEVAEGVYAAAGKEALLRIGRVAPLQCGVEDCRERCIRVAAQVVDGPAAQVILFGDVQRFQLGAGLAGMALIQLGDDFQIGSQHTQLGGGAQFQLAAFVDVEGLVGAVGLHANPAAAAGALEEGEAVAHLGGLLW